MSDELLFLLHVQSCHSRGFRVNTINITELRGILGLCTLLTAEFNRITSFGVNY